MLVSVTRAGVTWRLCSFSMVTWHQGNANVFCCVWNKSSSL